jgi:tyrosyl-tRNA synthetase
MKNLIEELKWRGLVQDIMPGTEEQLNKEMTTGYVGFDPTSDSLHIGSLLPILLLVHLQRAGHKPIALVGGATGMIGDPSGKNEERKLLTEAEIEHNAKEIKIQLEKFIDFTNSKNRAELVNNADWFLNLRTIEFLRDTGKYLTVSYLLSKGFIKDRMAQNHEISFTEFNYILMQAYDFYWLYKNKNCRLQMGGSDQWGNITAGAELIRKKIRGEAFAFTCPLLTKADGGKFGKTEKGNVWLDAKKTSPYQFYQFWLNAADEDAERYLKTFTFLTKDEIEKLKEQHHGNEHLRLLQQKLAEEVTTFVHSKKEYDFAVQASQILFSNETAEILKQLNEEELLQVMEGVPKVEFAKQNLGIDIISFLADTKIFASKGEAKKMVQGGGVSINKLRVESLEFRIDASQLLNEKYLLVQKGKKNYWLVKVV